MNSITIGLSIIIIGLIADHFQLKKEVRKLSMQLMRKVDKPAEETPTEKFTRERNERVARLEKEDFQK